MTSPQPKCPRCGASRVPRRRPPRAGRPRRGARRRRRRPHPLERLPPERTQGDAVVGDRRRPARHAPPACRIDRREGRGRRACPGLRVVAVAVDRQANERRVGTRSRAMPKCSRYACNTSSSLVSSLLGAGAVHGADQQVVGERDPPVLDEPRARQSLREVTGGRRLLVPARRAEVGEPPRAHVEPVLHDLAPRGRRSTPSAASSRRNTPHGSACSPRSSPAQRARREPPEPDVGEVGLDVLGATLHEQRHVVEGRAEPGGAVHLRRQVLDPEPERPQQGGERPVQLVAEAPTVLVDHLGDEGVLVEHDRLAEVDAEVLERHGPQVPLVQVGERGRPVGAEALQVPVDDAFVHAATICRGARDGRVSPRSATWRAPGAGAAPCAGCAAGRAARCRGAGATRARDVVRSRRGRTVPACRWAGRWSFFSTPGTLGRPCVGSIARMFPLCYLWPGRSPEPDAPFRCIWLFRTRSVAGQETVPGGIVAQRSGRAEEIGRA